MATRPGPRRGIEVFFMRFFFNRRFTEKECKHLDQIEVTNPTTDVCEDCVTLGDTWPDIRMCMICGYVGCCDTSKNKHMMKHFEETGHPLIRPVRPGRWNQWIWCYEDEALLAPRW